MKLKENKKYPFDENIYNKEIIEYIDRCNTKGHYAKDNKDIHTMELIIQGKDMRGLLHCTMTSLTYLDRFGYKGGYNRSDLLKAIHYLYFALYAYDNFGPNEKLNRDIIDK